MTVPAIIRKLHYNYKNSLFYLVIIRYLILVIIVCIDRDQTVGSLSSFTLYKFNKNRFLWYFFNFSRMWVLFERAIACKNTSGNHCMAIHLVPLDMILHRVATTSIRATILHMYYTFLGLSYFYFVQYATYTKIYYTHHKSSLLKKTDKVIIVAVKDIKKTTQPILALPLLLLLLILILLMLQPLLLW